MKKYFSWFSLIVSLPAIWYPAWLITQAVSVYQYCKRYYDWYVSTRGLDSYITKYYNCKFDYLSLLLTLPFFLPFILMYAYSYYVSKKIADRQNRIASLVVAWFLFALILAFDAFVYGLSQIH